MADVASAGCLPDAFLTVGRHAASVALSQPSLSSSPGSKAAAVPAGSTRSSTVVQLTEAQVLALPVATIETGTDWTGEVRRFEGPLLSDVLGLEPGQSGALNVIALNHSGATIPLSDIARFKPILAYAQDGVRLQRDDFGPLFIVYPRDRYSELRTPSMAARMVWQVCRIDVE